jgi:hypothetical protein
MARSVDLARAAAVPVALPRVTGTAEQEREPVPLSGGQRRGGGDKIADVDINIEIAPGGVIATVCDWVLAFVARGRGGRCHLARRRAVADLAEQAGGALV